MTPFPHDDLNVKMDGGRGLALPVFPTVSGSEPIIISLGDINLAFFYFGVKQAEAYPKRVIFGNPVKLTFEMPRGACGITESVP